MSNEHDKLTKELLQKTKPTLDSSFENDLMQQIEALPPIVSPKTVKVWHVLLVINIAIMFTLAVFCMYYFQSTQVVALFERLGAVLRFDVLFDSVNLYLLAIIGVTGCCFFYFLDLFLNDYFTLKSMKIEFGR